MASSVKCEREYLDTKLIECQYWQIQSLIIWIWTQKAFFPISYLSKTHLRKSEIRSNYESPYNTNIFLIAGENPPFIFCCWRTVFRSTSLNKYFVVVFFSSNIFQVNVFLSVTGEWNRCRQYWLCQRQSWNVDFRIGYWRFDFGTTFLVNNTLGLGSCVVDDRWWSRAILVLFPVQV